MGGGDGMSGCITSDGSRRFSEWRLSLLVGGGHAAPLLKVGLVLRISKIAVVLARLHAHPVHPRTDIAIVRLLEQGRHGQPRLDVFFRFVGKNVLAVIRAKVVLFALVLGLA